MGLNNLPLDTAQSGGTVSNAAEVQPYSESTTNDSGEAVDTRTLTFCSELPTRRSTALLMSVHYQHIRFCERLLLMLNILMLLTRAPRTVISFARRFVSSRRKYLQRTDLVIQILTGRDRYCFWTIFISFENCCIIAQCHCPT